MVDKISEKRGLSPISTVVELEMGYAADEFGRVLRGTFTGETSPYRCNDIKSHHWAIEQPGEVFDLVIDFK